MSVVRDDLHDCIIRLGIWQAFDLKISWSHTHNNHHIFGRGIWEKEIVSAKCHTKQLWVYMYVSIQQYKRIGMWAAVIWIDEDMKNLESTLLATSLYIWLPNKRTGLNERTKKTILFIANQLIRVAAESKSCDVTNQQNCWSTFLFIHQWYQIKAKHCLHPEMFYLYLISLNEQESGLMILIGDITTLLFYWYTSKYFMLFLFLCGPLHTLWISIPVGI